MLAPRSARQDLLILAAICAVAFFPGLATHGLTNWQEAMRALVAREMHSACEWIVPTVEGRPYLAKPPLIYWCQLLLNVPRSAPPGEFELRLTVALAGTLGVLTTYFAALCLLRPWPDSSPTDPWPRHVAFWSAAFLATGILYVRSSRIGEIDILLAPATAGAVGAIALAWRHALSTRRTHFGWIAVACACSTLAALAKGPPGLLTLALAAYGGIGLWCLLAPGEQGRRLPALWLALSRTHPIAILGLPLLVLWGWTRLVAHRVGPDAVASAIHDETGENLVLFSPEALPSNLEALAYGVGLGSVAALIALIWLIKDRPALAAIGGRGFLIVLAWVLLPLVAFSLIGKGVPRYLTPTWPGVAILGAMWFASAVRDFAWGRTLSRAAGVLVALLALGQGLWYGYGRERAWASRSPRAFITDLLRPERSVDPARIAGLDIWTPALDFYVCKHVEPITDVGPWMDWPGPAPRTLDQLRSDLAASGGTLTMLVRARAHPDIPGPAPADRLVLAGFGVETIPLQSSFTIDNGKTPVVAVRVWALRPD